MNTQKLINSALAVGGFALMAAGAQAQQVTFASATGAGAGASTVFTYTGGANGQFTTTAGSQFLATFLPTFTVNAPATLAFTGFMANGMATGTGTAVDPFTQGLGAGTFNLTSAGNTLLTGSFTGGNLLTAINGSTTASITNSVNNVTYTGGSYFTASGLKNPGSFSISMTSVTPNPSISNGFLNAFTAGGTSTFSATQPQVTTVPEPASIVPFALGGLALLGLAARKGRRTSRAAA